jgi:hypothetical protein
MTTKSKLLLVFGLLFGGMFVFIIGSGFFFLFVSPFFSEKRSVELNRKRSAETIGTFTSVSKHHSRVEKTGGGGTSYTYNYKYVVNDVSYSAEQSSSGGAIGEEETSGMQVKVCYDPADPKSSKYYSLKTAKTCGN